MKSYLLLLLVLLLLTQVIAQDFPNLINVKGCAPEIIDGSTEDDACISSLAGGGADKNGNIFFLDNYTLRKYDPQAKNLTTMSITMKGSEKAFTNTKAPLPSGCISAACSTKRKGCFMGCSNALFFMDLTGYIEKVIGVLNDATFRDGSFEVATISTPKGITVNDNDDLVFLRHSNRVSVVDLVARTVQSITFSISQVLTGFSKCDGSNVAVVTTADKLYHYQYSTKTTTPNTNSFAPVSGALCISDKIYFYDNNDKLIKVITVSGSGSLTMATFVGSAGNQADGIGTAAKLGTVDAMFQSKSYIWLQESLSTKLRSVNLATKEVKTVLSHDSSVLPYDSNSPLSGIHLLANTFFGAYDDTTLIVVIDPNIGVVNFTAGTTRLIQTMGSNPGGKSGAPLFAADSKMSLALDDDGNIYMAGLLSSSSTHRRIYKLRPTSPGNYEASTLVGRGENSFVQGVHPANSITLKDLNMHVLKGKYLHIFDIINNRLLVVNTQTGVLDSITSIDFTGVTTSTKLDDNRLLYVTKVGSVYSNCIFDNTTMTSYCEQSALPPTYNFGVGGISLIDGDVYGALQVTTTLSSQYFGTGLNNETLSGCIKGDCFTDSVLQTSSLGLSKGFIQHGSTVYALESNTIRKLAIVPPSLPTVSIVTSNSTAVTLSMSLPIRKWGGAQLTKFKVTWSSQFDDCGNESTTEVEANGEDKYTVVLGGLEKFTGYLVEVTAVNSRNLESFPTTLLVSTN